MKFELKFSFLILIFTILRHSEGLKLIKRRHLPRFLEIKEQHQFISRDEFQFRIISYMFNGIKYEKNLDSSQANLDAFESRFHHDKLFKCSFGKNIYFASKLIYHSLSLRLNSINSYLSKEEFEVTSVLRTFSEFKEMVQELLAVGQNIYCHKQIKNLEMRIDPNIKELIKKIRLKKLQLLQNFLKFQQNIFQYKFNINQLNLKNIHLSLSFQQYLQKSEDFLKQNNQNQEQYEHLKDVMLRIYAALIKFKDTKENKERWGTILGEYMYSILQLKFILQQQSSLIQMKKYSSKFNQKQLLFSNSLEKYFREELNQNDENNVLRLTKHFSQVISSVFLMSQSWHMYFQQENFLEQQKTEKNFILDDIYKTAGKENNLYKTCNAISELQETINTQNFVMKQLYEISFIDEKINNQNQYKSSVEQLFQAVCQKEVDKCLEVFYEIQNKKTITKLIKKICENFFKSLVKLKKTGPISDIGISQNPIQELYYLKMGYKSIYQNRDKSIIVWSCRNCGGGYIISNLEFQSGTIDQYENLIPDPSKIVLVFQIFKDVYMVVEKVLMSSVVLSADMNGSLPVLSKIIYDDPQTMVWTSFGLNSTETGFFTMFNKWNFQDDYWCSTDLPKFFNLKSPITQEKITVPTLDSEKCKMNMLLKIKNVQFEDSYEDVLLWSFSIDGLTEDQIEHQLDLINQTDCINLGWFRIKPNSDLVIIDQENKKMIEEQKSKGDSKASDLIIERIPQKPLYFSYIWLYPFDNSENEEISLHDIKEILVNKRNVDTTQFREALCQKSRNYCTFLDTPYDEYQKKLIEKVKSFPSESIELNYAKSNKNSDVDQYQCIDNYLQLPKVDSETISQANKIFQELFTGKNLQNNTLYQVFQRLAQRDCETSKIFPLKFSCSQNLKYLQLENNNLQEVCFDQQQDVQSNKSLQQNSRIAIKDQVYIVVRLTQSKSPQQIDLEQIQNLGYYYYADWIKLPKYELKNSEGLTYYMTTQIYVKIDSINHDYIGLPDSYSDDKCILNFNHLDRYNGNQKSLYQSDNLLYKLEKSLQYSLVPQRLQFYQENFNFASKEKEKFNQFLNQVKCEYIRVFLPIKWKGDDINNCLENFSIKSLQYLPQSRGLIETCDGGNLPIGSIYYMELLIYLDPTIQEYKAPTDIEIDIAKKQGYILMGTQYPIKYSKNGYSTKIRLWVKPKPDIINQRKNICRNSFEDDEDFDIKTDKTKNSETWTRVVVESKLVDQ